MSEIQTFSLENLTKFNSHFRHSDFRYSFYRLIILLTSEIRTFGCFSQSTKCLKSELFGTLETPKSECSDFRRLLFSNYNAPKSCLNELKY